MKAFIERVFKSKKQKQKELLDEIANTKIVEENKKIITKQIEERIKEIKKEPEVVYPKPNHFPDCNCFKCGRWKNQNA
jgi:hypothetical protein